MRIIPNNLIENVNQGYAMLQGFIWPAILIGVPASFIAYIFPAFKVWEPLPALVAYAAWIGLQYHFGRIKLEHKEKKMTPEELRHSYGKALGDAINHLITEDEGK